MRLVLDTNVVVAALIGTGAPARLIELAGEGDIELYSSGELMTELAGVLQREHIARRLLSVKQEPAGALAFYEALVEQVTPASIQRTAPDPADDAVLACALAAQADCIVSGDKRLRNLKRFHAMPIHDPAEAVLMITRPVSR